MTVGECEKKIVQSLTKAGVESPGLCALMLLQKVSGKSRLELALEPARVLVPDMLEELGQLVKRRCQGEPMAYILGQREFYEHSFHVSPATLIPRPETELLVELALELFGGEKILFLDAGCGCGNIGLSLLAIREKWQGILVDRSRAALAVTHKNSRRIAPGAIMVEGDLGNLPVPAASLDLLISNPPYIGPHEKVQVLPDVLEYEPEMALFSGDEGYAHLKALAREGLRVLKPGGWLLVEHGFSQQDRLRDLLGGSGFQDIRTYRDLASLPRCVAARRSLY